VRPVIDLQVWSMHVLPSEGAMALLALGAINRMASLGLVAEHPHAYVACVGVLGCPLTHLCLQEYESNASECDSSALHCEIASSGTRCSSCKPVVFVTLGGFHLLDGLVVVSVDARKEDCVVLQRSDCEGYCAHPAGATKSNSSRACH
jgi:hypothetical protein